MRRFLWLLVPWVFSAACSLLPEVQFVNIHFDSNHAGARGTMIPASSWAGASFPLPECTFEVSGYEFTGWSKTPAGTVSLHTGDTVVLGSSDITLYAHWTLGTYSLIFDKAARAATGTMAPLSGLYGATVTLPSFGFLWAGHHSVGWSQTPGGRVVWTHGATVTIPSSSLVLYAKWALGAPGETITATVDGEAEATLTFTPSTATAALGDTLDIEITGTFDTYAWALDGNVLPGEAAATLALDTTGLDPGPHQLVAVVSTGTEVWSGRLRVEVTQ